MTVLGRLQATVAQFTDRRVLVVGDIMLDRYLVGERVGIAADHHTPVFRTVSERSNLGGAANCAANARALGAQVYLAGVLGDDDAGHGVMTALHGLGINQELILTLPRRPTTRKTRLKEAAGPHIARFDTEIVSDIPAEAEQFFAERIAALLPNIDAIVLSDYDKGVLTRQLTATVLTNSRSLGLPTIVDPKIAGFFNYIGATVFKPNRKEVETALRNDGALAEDQYFDTCARLQEQVQCKMLLVTLGPQGMLLRVNGDFFRIEPTVRHLEDVEGAGDTVAAVMALALSSGATAEDAAILANRAAGITCQKSGVVALPQDELVADLRLAFPT